MARLSPIDCYCAKCGASPSQPCSTSGGNRTAFHKARINGEPTSWQQQRAVKLECWRLGWKAGTAGMKTAQAQELATAYTAPEDFTTGWQTGCDARDLYEGEARRKYMGGL